MNYIDTLNTFLAHRFTTTVCSAQGPCNTSTEVPLWQLKTLLQGLSDNQFHNLIEYLKEEGHILHTDAATITFCPHYIATLQPYPGPPQRGGRCFAITS